VLQRRQRFRAGEATVRYALTPEEDVDLEENGNDVLRFHHQNQQGEWRAEGNLCSDMRLQTGPGIAYWGIPDYWTQLKTLVEATGYEPVACAKRFAWVQLRENTQGWEYHPLLGFKRKK